MVLGTAHHILSYTDQAEGMNWFYVVTEIPPPPDEYEKGIHIISHMCGTFKSQINAIENRLMLSGPENEMYIEKGDVDKIT